MKTNFITTIVKSSLFATAAFCLAMSLAHAEPNKKRERPAGPPPEAIEACEGMNEGDSVSFENREGDTLTGTCEMIEEQLVAVPEGRKKRKQR
ncbi:hypothetical protein ISG33_12705 [Glaciecola sp. MH2013]|uniref:hypothetical protein n=1 Tax=Glaciecola sp. MH2013 TaxID=2785524 RepID=UPI00189F2400|nr:hypothetical protein [Glaciecola sp. MH2013]MBF7074259.1 hypothetical protein [Glaciecola sp. MH2013]